MTLKYGSRGEDVTALQRALNDNGYALETDGIYGVKTQAAVKDYQRKNALTVDGIAGAEALGALQKAASEPADDSDYRRALSALETVEAQPPAYANSYADRLQALYRDLTGRGSFTYDPQSDPLFRGYADTYRRSGELAMQDTAGRAAALTGGYANSYAQTAGEQQYQSYLQKLGDVLPTLYGRAYGQYQDENTRKQQEFALLRGLAEDEYTRYRDALDQWQTARQQLQARADTAYDRALARWKAK